MRHRIPSATTLLALALAFAGQGGSARATLVDPTGDTFGVGPVQIDIASVDAVTSPLGTTFTVTFAGPISAPSAAAFDSVVGFLDIDVDRDPSTGAAPQVNAFSPGPPVALGSEFLLDLGSELFNPGLVDLFDSVTNDLVANVPIVFGSDFFRVTVPVVGTGASPVVDYALLVGTFAEPTDRSPNGSVPGTSVLVPEPFGGLQFGVGAGLMLGWRRRRSRRTAA